MAKITITAEIDTLFPHQMKAAMEFMAAMGGHVATVGVENKCESTCKAKEELAQTPTQSPVEKQAPEKTSDISLDDIREVLSSKVKSPSNRKLLKKKLTSLGVEKIPALQPGQFQEVLDFLNTLPDPTEEA